MSENTTLAVYQKITDPIQAAAVMGHDMARSGMFGFTSDAQGAVCAMTCICEGITPIEFKRTYHVFPDGKISMRSDAMLAGFRTKAKGTHRIISRTTEKAAIELTLDGHKTEFSFTWAEAQDEPFVRAKDGKAFKTNWNTPRIRMQMLWARVVSDAVRAVAPEIVAGVYTPEEVQDFDNKAPARPAIFVSSAPAAPAATAEPPADIIDAETGEVIEPPQVADQPTIEQAITDAGCSVNDAVAYLIDKAKWLNPGEGLGNLAETQRTAILNRTAAFVVKVDEYVKGVLNG